MKKQIVISLMLGSSLFAADYSGVIESPKSAAKIIKEDLLPPTKAYTMPANCVTTYKESIARGAFIFHNLNAEKIKTNPPKGLAKVDAKGAPKQYGNCVACHNIEGAKGGGNIGPDLSGYADTFMKSGIRDKQFVYQKIADPRVDNLDTHMTVNLTTKLFNEKEICDIASYVVSPK
jgi:sulfur-oxidizing protein SoxX